MEVLFIKTHLDRLDQDIVSALLEDFTDLYGIDLHSLTIDLRKTRNNYNSDGMFGGFLDMYNPRTKTAYFNPHEFIEYKEWDSPYNLAHLAMHELIHVRQIQNKEMKILTPNKLRWKGKDFTRAPFCVDLFNRIREKTPDLAEEYHWRALPWERDAYSIPEDYMGQPLWRAYS